MKSNLVFLLVVLLCFCLFRQTAFAENPPRQQLYELFADRDYAEAIVQLQSLLEQKADGQDEFLYLMGNAHFYQKEYDNAITWYQKLVKEFPDSTWKQKAVFKQADCYIKLQQFQQAADIYEQEVTLLVSPERKERIAEVYLQFADEYFRGTWVKRQKQQGIEEQPDYARAKTFYELALQMELSPEKAEEIRFQIARCAFELANYAEAVTALLALQSEYPEGTYLTKATYYLGQSYLQQGQMLQARKVLRDFVEEYPDDRYAPEAAFLVSRTYNIPHPHSAETLELGIKSLQDFLKSYPDDERVVRAEYEIGLSYANFTRYDDAIRIFTAYLEQHEGESPSRPAGAGENTDAEPLTMEDALPSVRYLLGRMYQAQRKFKEAIAVWQEYLQKYPSHKQWSQVQHQIIQSEYEIADVLFHEEQYVDARNAWEQFLAAHPLDSRNPQIMYRIGEAFAEEERYQEAIAQWKRTVSKYPDTDSASQAQYNIARLLESTLFTFEEAFETYKKLTWGAYYGQAQQRLEEMQAKSLMVRTERSFRSSETAVLRVKTRNIENLTLKMYKVDLETYFRKMQATEGVDGLDIALIDPDKTWQETIEEYERYREFENRFSMPFSEPGAYLVTCSEENVSDEVGYEATTFVLISDLDIIVKTTKRDALVFAQNMKTGAAYSDVKLLLSDGQKVFFEGSTKEDGVFHHAMKELQDVQIVNVFASDGTHYAATDLAISDLHYVAGLESRGYVYTDRPAYRPDQQVHIKGILRQVDEQGNLRVPQSRDDEQSYTVQVLSSQGTTVYQDDVLVNEFGTFAADFTLSSVVPTGEYRILVSRGKQSYSGHFLVERYKLEKVKLTLETERDVYFRGETITGTISAEYYYGEPLQKKSITYSLAGLETVTGLTDDTGKIAFSLSTRDFAESQTITLHARLDDENVQTAKNVWLATRGFSCAVSTIRDIYLVGEDIEVSVRTDDPAGKPLAQDMILSILKREYTAYDEAEVKIAEHKLNTGESGKGKALIRIAEGGDYLLRAEGRDRFGNPVSGQTELFISGKDDDIMLRFMTDVEEFRVGDQPEVSLFSRASAGLGLLTYEGESILSYQIINIQPEHNPLQLDISSVHAPNFTLSVAQMEGNRFHEASKEFSVIQQLDITFEVKRADDSKKPEFFEPGESFEVEITTTDQNGKPVAAELSLAMVDESLYAQYADRIPSIQDFFYDQRRELVSRTDSSCTFSFDAETTEIVTDILEEETRFATLPDVEALEEADDELLNFADISISGDTAPNVMLKSRVAAPSVEAPPKAMGEMQAVPPVPPGKDGKENGGEFLSVLREYFPETGYWNPSIVTDSDGKATITITLPDSTTEWRLTSRGITIDTLAGEATSGIITKLPFFADIKLPAVFVEGDRATVLASIHNYSGNTQEADIRFTSSQGNKLLEQQEQVVSMNNQEVTERVYPIDLSDIDEPSPSIPLTVKLDASAGALRDRIKREVPVRPWGVEYVTTQSGTLRDSRTIAISLPEEREYRSLEMDILINPSIDRTLVDLTQERPWPFKMPASSRIHEAQLVLNALQYLKADGEMAARLSDPVVQELQTRLKALLAEINLTQNPDGGWNWIGSEQRSDLFVAADAVTVLSEAEHQGYQIQPETLKKGIRYLQQAFQSAQDNDIKTYLLHTLTLANSVDFAHVNRVYRERNSLSTTGLALLMNIYSSLKRPEIAAELNGILQQRAHVQHDRATGKQMVYWASDSPYPWLQSDVEVTARVLSALQAVDPVSSRIPEAVEWLYTQRQWSGWGSMRTNAVVSLALRLYLDGSRYAENRYVLNVFVNNQLLAELQVNGEQGHIPVRVPGHILTSQQNSISFDFQGRGIASYVCILQGTSRDIRQTREFYAVSRYYEPAALVFNGKEMPRGFSVLDGSYSTWRNKVTQLPLGGFTRVTLEYNRRDYDRERSYKNHRLILEEPIPSGCTVLEQSIQGGYLDYDIIDGKIVFYLNNAHYGRVSYDLYGYLPGDYKVLPTKIRAAYEPERLDYGEIYEMQVLERGQAVTENYRKTPDELYHYGKALFEEKRFNDARPFLRELFSEYRLRAEPYRDTVKMLMYIAIAEDDSGDIVQYFEILKEKYPNLVLSFEDIIRVGRAYQEIQEYERAVQVFRATAEASFFKDVQVSGTLEAQGEFLPSVEYTGNLLQEYPDIPTTETTFYALSQLLSTEAERMRQNPGAFRNAPLSRQELLRKAAAMLHQFLAYYPDNPIVDEVSFSLANAYLELEDFEAVVTMAQRFRQRYPKSPFLSGYQYIEGYANFELERYEKSLELCRNVATQRFPDKHGKMVESDHKNLAQYIMGQIYHSMGNPEQAIAEYEKVQEQFPDAKEAIRYFTRKRLELDEVTTFQPGDETRVILSYRNVEEVNILAYRVDLMKLYLLQKNLNAITHINLAGITPYHQENIQLSSGKEYVDKNYSLELPLKEDGAYLVVAKEAELDTSGMVLLSQLTLDVEEDAVSGRVRVNVKNAESGRYEKKVHVKVIGSHDSEFVSGPTDVRGIFIADNIHGTATVIARKGNQYAFFRGETMLQAPERPRPPMQQLMVAPGDMRSQAVQQLRATNQMLQQQSEGYLRKNLYQNTQKGVEVQATY